MLRLSVAVAFFSSLKLNPLNVFLIRLCRHHVRLYCVYYFLETVGGIYRFFSKELNRQHLNMGLRSSKQKADITTPTKDKVKRRKSKKGAANGDTGIEEVGIQEKKDEVEISPNAEGDKKPEEESKKAETDSTASNNAPTDIVEDSPDKETQKIAELKDVQPPSEPIEVVSQLENVVVKPETQADVSVPPQVEAKQEAVEPEKVKESGVKEAQESPKAVEPTPIVETKPEPVPVKESKPEPTPAVETKPEPTPVKESKPEPTPAVETKPEPTPVEESKPEPTPVVETKPEPTPVEEVKPEPTPVEEVKSEPIPIVETKPEPTPVEESKPEPTPVEIKAEPTLVEESKSVPIVEAQPEPAPVVEAKPEPTELPEAKPVEGSKPEQVSDEPQKSPESFPPQIPESEPTPEISQEIVQDKQEETMPEAIPETVPENKCEATPVETEKLVPELAQKLEETPAPEIKPESDAAVPEAEKIELPVPEQTVPESKNEVAQEPVVEPESSPVEDKTEVQAEPEIQQTEETKNVLEEKVEPASCCNGIAENGVSPTHDGVQQHSEVASASPTTEETKVVESEERVNGLESVVQNGTSQVSETEMNGQKTDEIPSDLATLISWKHGGEEVAVCGDFCKWEDNCLLSNNDGIFSTKIKLPKGQHHIKFLVDGKWTVDESEPVVELEGHGQVNLLVV